MKNFLRSLMQRVKLPVLLILVALAFIIGYLAGGDGEHRHSVEAEQGKDKDSGKASVWTCSMHPQIRLPKPGQCPICFMDLIPIKEEGEEAGEADAGAPRLTMSESARKLAEIATAPVRSTAVTQEVRMVGKVDYDETRLAYITAWVPGRLDQLYVDYTGVPVRKGDHMVYLYSPALISAQEELLQAAKAVRELEQSRIKIMQETAVKTMEASREKLRLLGLTPRQIEEVEARGEPVDHITIYAPIGGIVIHKNAMEGMYVETGTKIYTIADLSSVWVKLDAYESDLAWIRYGQEVEFTTEAYPGEVFKGRISFIDPVVDQKTRTVKLRLNVPNPGDRLKPEMFVRAVLRSRVTSMGKVIDVSLEGKWICPMHPSVIKGHKGTCDICGMDLVSPSSLGYASKGAKAEPQLVIPASAPLITGKRAVVYVRVPGAEKPAFEGREVVLGPRAGDYYLVQSGLTEGEEVVVQGNFKIDSALQILARPSMMSPEGGAPIPGHAHHGGEGAHREIPQGEAPVEKVRTPQAFLEDLSPVYGAYFELQRALAGDDHEASRRAFDAAAKAADGVDMSLVAGRAHETWMDLLKELTETASRGGRGADLNAERKAFRDLSAVILELEERFGHPGGRDHFKVFCPMAFENQGAPWLQETSEISNPYFGKSMLRCGEVQQTFHALKAEE